MSDDKYVWIAEAYNAHGERVEQIVHLREDDAWEDVQVMTEGKDVSINVEREKVWTGQGSFDEDF